MAIRFDKKLNQEINRTIKNFNQKIARLEKSEKELLLPNKVKKQELLSNVYDRYNLRKKLKELQRFSKRGAEDIITLESGARISNYEYENIKIESRAIKARLTRQINRLKVEKIRIGGEKQDSTFAESGDKNYLNLVARREALNKHLAGLDEEHLILYKKLINKSKRNSRYYDNIFMGNYLESLSQIGEFYGYDANKIQEIKEKLLELDSKKFTQLFNEDQIIKAILDYNISPKSRKRKAGVNLLAVKDDVIELYDALYDKLDVILEEAK